MKSTRIEVTRQELYEQVWAKLRHGHEVQRTPLPDQPEDGPQSHTFYIRTGLSDDDEDEIRVRGIEPPFVIPAFQVPSRLYKPHPLVARTRDALKTYGPDRYGRVQPGRGEVLDVSVFPGSVHRAPCILNALVKLAENIGLEVGAEENWAGSSYVLVEGEKVRFRIFEKARREDHEPDGKKPYRSRRWDYFPSGVLTLMIGRGVYGVRRRWHFREGENAEDLLGSFLMETYKAAHSIKKWQRYLNQSMEASREAQRRVEEEQAFRETIERQAHEWKLSRTIVEYIAEVEQLAAERTLRDVERSRYDEWLRRARAHADQLNPLGHRLPYEQDDPDPDEASVN